MTRACASLAVACASGAATAAVFHVVDLSAVYNGSAGGLTGGLGYPLGTQDLGGVPFQLSDTHDSYFWGAGIQGGPNPITLEIGVGVFGVRTGYTLIGTAWGSARGGLLAVEFIGSDGAFASFDLVGDEDVRDYNQNRFTNSINGTSTVNVFNTGTGQRLDRQRFDLPSDFWDETLETVRIVDTGADGLSRALLFGATVEVPAPGTGVALVCSVTLASRRRR
jgi:hypothetical protein